MRPPRRYTTEAVVIRHRDFDEADRILTLLTPSHGKVHAIAKGVRRSRSRSGGHLDLFTRCTLLIAQGRNLDIVIQAQAVEYFPELRNNLVFTGQAHYVAELFDSFVPDNLPNAQLYALQVATLRTINLGATPLHIRAFELNLLDLSGYRPQLHTCLGCGKAVVPEANRFSSTLGGIICHRCHDQDPAARDISVPGLKLLRLLQTDPPRALRLASIDPCLGREIEHRLHEYIAYRLEKRPKSIRVLERLEGPMAARAVPAGPT